MRGTALNLPRPSPRILTSMIEPSGLLGGRDVLIQVRTDNINCNIVPGHNTWGRTLRCFQPTVAHHPLIKIIAFLPFQIGTRLMLATLPILVILLWLPPQSAGCILVRLSHRVLIRGLSTGFVGILCSQSRMGSLVGQLVDVIGSCTVWQPL